MMKYEIILDENNYISCIVHNGDERDIYDDEFIFNTFYKDGHRVNCYKKVDDEYILDEPKEQEEIAKEQEENEIARLKSELCKYDYIGTKLAMGVATKEEYAEQIAYTETIREQIRQLETFRTESEQPKEV